MKPDAASIRFRTNAKLNLFLRVVGRRPDGYHELESIFHSVGLADDIYLSSSETQDIEVDMRFERGLLGEAPRATEDLTYIAAQRLIERGATNPGLRIEIVKRIPIGSGLGGGSGNAAGVLVALKELWQMELEQTELAKVASLVGSDVAFCLNGGTALATDRGGKLTPLPAPEPMRFVLGMSFEPLETKTVYETWDEVGASSGAAAAPMALALGTGDVTAVAALLHNDLEGPAFTLRPELADKKRAILEAGALGAGMSGSGPTLFGIARDAEEADRIAASVGPLFDRVVTVTSVPRCIERID